MRQGKEDNERDAFWDLSDLLPVRKRAPRPSFSTAVSVVEVKDAHPSPSAEQETEGRFSLPPKKAVEKEQEALVYERPDNRFITRVRVLRRHSDYQFYGQFCRDAVRYLDKEGKECPFAPYFSYIPQYAQLTEEQLAYYLYWRSCLRRGEYIRTEESYFFLFVYEIINLPEIIMPKDGVLLLLDAWAAYRKDLPRIDKFMTEWVMDYCLVHNLACPLDRLRPFLSTILPLASHKEFYLGAMGDGSREGTETALAFLSAYRFRESRYLSGEQSALFEEHILSCMTEVLSALLHSHKDVMCEAARTVRVHEAFCGSLCAQSIRCRLEITYYSVQDVSYLRGSVTAALKYAENKIRAALSVKSRLSVPPLDKSIRECVDAYFDRVSRRLTPVREREIPAYEKLYDAPRESTDLSRADQIERESWSNTRALVSEEEWQEIENNQKTDPYPSADNDFMMQTTGDDVQSLTPLEREYLQLVLEGKRESIRAFLARHSVLEEELACSLNEKGMEKIGDVILESGESGYALVPDYVEEVSEWIR